MCGAKAYRPTVAQNNLSATKTAHPGKGSLYSDRPSLKQRNVRASGFRGFVRVGKRANALHAGLAAIGIFPYKLVAVAVPADGFGPPAKHIKVQKIVLPNPRRRGARAIFARANGEHNLAFRVICDEPAGSIGAVIVNNASGRDHRAVAALFNALDMFATATRNGAPQTANVIGTLSQGLGAFSQYRQRKM